MTGETWAARHEGIRDALLERMLGDLRSDPRFLAAWLFGSFGRGEEDAFSDLDVTVVVAAPHAEALCARPWPSAGRTTPERLAIFSRWGTPVVVHDVHRNAPEGGAQTNVVYSSGTQLDINLIPAGGALRPFASRLLFDHAGVPVEEAPQAESLAERRRIAGQRMALFWIMVMVGAKYRLRGAGVLVQSILAALHGQLADVRRLVAGDPPHFTRPAKHVHFAATPDDQLQALRELADEMEALIPAVRAMGEDVRPAPRETLELWLSAVPAAEGRGGDGGN